MRRTRHTTVRLGAALAAAVLLSACASKTFDVKVVPRVEPEAIGPAKAAGPLAVHAAAVWDEDYLLETFDANLILAGVLPVRVAIENRGAEPLAARKLDFELSGGGKTKFKYLSPDRARKAIEAYYGITVRSKIGDKLYQQDFAANALDLEAELAPGEARQGFVFFALPKGVDRRVPAVLSVRSKRHRAVVELPLS